MAHKGALLAFLTFAAATWPQAGSALELKLAHFMSPKHVMHAQVLEPLAAELAEATGGALTIQIYPAGELGAGPQQQYQRAVNGVADITFGLQGYTSNLFPRTMLAELPGIAETPRQVTEMIWNAYDPYLAAEYEGVTVLGIWANDMAVLMTRERPIASLEDIRGMKIRTPSAAQARILEALGAEPVSMPVTKIYNALQTGIIDGVMIGPCSIPGFKLNEVARHYTLGAPLANTTFFTVMNEQAWTELDEDGKAALAGLTGRDMSVKAAAAYAECGERGIELARAGDGNSVVELSEAERARWRAAVAPVIDRTIAELTAAGHPAVEILTEMGVSR